MWTNKIGRFLIVAALLFAYDEVRAEAMSADYQIVTFSGIFGDDPGDHAGCDNVADASTLEVEGKHSAYTHPAPQILKDGLTQLEVRDWLCPQVTKIEPIPDSCSHTSRARMCTFQGRRYWCNVSWCGNWHGPTAGGKGVATVPVAVPATRPANNVLKYPSNMTGLLRDCLKQVTGDTGQDKPKYAEGTQSEDWQAAFDRDWKTSTRGSGGYQQQMLAQGNIWVEGRGWVEGKTIQGEQQTCVANHLKEQIVRIESSLSPDQQLMISNIARQIMADGDPATRMAELQRLRQGTFLTVTAEADRAYNEATYTSDAMQIQERMATTALDTFTTYTPPFNDVRFFYEACTGREAFTGRELGWWERALNAGFLLLGYGNTIKDAVGNTLKDTVTASRSLEEAMHSGRLTAKETKLFEEAMAGGTLSDEAKALIPDYAAREAAANEVRRQAAEKVKDYIAAVKTRDPDLIRKTVIELKGDGQAISLLNKESNFVKNKFNQEIRQVYSEVDEEVKKRVAEQYNRKIAAAGKDHRFVPNQAHGLAETTVTAEAARAGEAVRPEDVTIFSASNPSSNVKVGRDRDYTIRIFGQDVPSKEASEIYNKAMHETLNAKGMLPKGVKTAEELGKKLDQTAVHWLDAEAYNKKSLSLVLNPAEKGLPATERRLMGDVKQVGETMEFKGTHNFGEGDNLRSEYRKLGQAETLHEAESATMEGMYQIRKQFDNQIMGRIAAAQQRQLIDYSKVQMSSELRGAIHEASHAGNTALKESLQRQALIPERLSKEIAILRKIEDADWSAAKAHAVLKQVFGKNPEDVARELKEAMESWEKLIMSKGK